MNFLLRIKNWQLFFLLLIPCVVMSFLDFVHSERSLLNNLICGIYIFIIIAWNYIVIKEFNVKANIFSVRNLLLVDCIYYCTIASCLSVLYLINLEYSLLIDWILSIAIITSISGLLFLVFNSSKILRMLKNKERRDFAGVIGTMIMILYFPVGIWWIQSKVNKYYMEIH